MSNEKFVINDDGLKRFCELSVNVLNKHAPRKKKNATGNQMPFFTKELSIEIMTKSRLRNKYLKNRNEENRAIYVKQRNYCVSLLRKSKKKYYENLDERNLMDNKLFWKTIKPSFSDKIVTRDKVHLTENGEVVKTELETPETLNNFFGNVIKNLMIPKYSEYDPSIDRVENRTIRAILKYRNHPSILTIRELKEVSIEEIQKEIVSLNNKKASQNPDIPTKIIKENSDIFEKVLCSFINDSITFPSCLKDLSKAFNCLDHELLIAKLNAYSFSIPALRLINDYLSNRRQQTRIGNSFSDLVV